MTRFTPLISRLVGEAGPCPERCALACATEVALHLTVSKTTNGPAAILALVMI
ncbi:hypothetical protein G7043_26750 [Lentzea sp. NEAU-D13]|uniref:Uncharacterized protein n=1 Tax=Lentzea alba TaxID=2714351 RepID=A0A7C9RTU5_9PSEU|nr:hypothetical protein [Lentzea alba]NGY62527.1 hypothetical protein [Lentzea alba]